MRSRNGMPVLPRWCMRSLAGVVPLLLLTSASALSQVHFGLYTSSMYDDNSFSIYDKRADVYHSLFGALSTDAKLGRYAYMQGYYYGAIVLFRTFADRTYNIHTLGAYTQIQLDYRDDEDHVPQETGVAGPEADSRNGPAPPVIRSPREDPVFNDSLVSWLFIIPQAGARFDRERWNFYDFQRGSVLFRYHRPFIDPLAMQLLYHVQYKRYPHLEQFTHLEHIGGLNLNYEFSRRMELFFAADYGYKSYTHSVHDTSSGDGSDDVRELTTPSTSQLQLSGGVVLRLFSAAPLAISYLRRMNPLNTARYVEQVAIIGSTEDEIFDDRYGYEGHEFRLQLQGQLPGRIETHSALQFILKDYPRQATDLNGIPVTGQPMRADRRFMLQLQALYPLFRAPDGTGLSVGLAYNFIRNQSNDVYHNYHVHQAALLLSGYW